MLSVVGLIVPEFFHLPQFTPGVTPYESCYTVSNYRIRVFAELPYLLASSVLVSSIL